LRIPALHLHGALLFAAFACFAGEYGPEEVWDGPLLKPVAREEVFEFAQKPSFRKAAKDRYEVSFAARGRCDVAVAIEDETGKVVRHLVYGVLGPNAPEPLKKDSLEQTLAWDGKDDAGNYVERPERTRVRVSLGLRPAFERLLGWHPKNIGSDRRVSGIAADAGGVYVLTGGERPQLQAYSHDASYLRTLIPFAADKIEEFKRADLATIKLKDGYVAYYPGSGPTQGGGARGNYLDQSLEGEATPTLSQRMACAAGRLAFGSLGDLSGKAVMRIRTDGSLDGRRFYGFNLQSGTVKKGGFFRDVSAAPDRLSYTSGNHALAASPDGKWLYLTGLRGRFGAFKVSPYGDPDRLAPAHAVYRVPWDTDAPLDKPFIGAAMVPGSDNDQLNTPTSVATDAKGNLYVADTGNNRIQVFDPEGRHRHTIKLSRPAWLDVDQKTGALYALADIVRGKLKEHWSFRLVKLAPLPAPRIVFEKAFDYGLAASDPVFCVDAWTTPPTLWLTHRHGEIALYEDRGESLALKHEFVEDVRKAGHIPFFFSSGYRHCLSADPVHGHLYLYQGDLYRFEPSTGRCVHLELPKVGGEMDEFLVGPDGLAYLRTCNYILRYELDAWRPVPYDYGELVSGGWGFKSRGAIRFPWPHVFHCQTGFGVAPNGDLLALGIYSEAFENLRVSSAWHMDGGGSRKSKDLEGFFRPKPHPGRPATRAGVNVLCTWDRRGEEKLFDAVKGIPIQSSCVRGDREGNIYLGFGAQKYDEDGQVIYGNSLVKFTRHGGQFLFSEAGAPPLGDPPKRPPEFRHLRHFGADIWTRGQLLWAYGGVNTMVRGTCFCPQLRFDVDLYGRVFVPEAHRCSVAVLDTNGNFILRLGKYGNADSGRGPDIALAFCTYLAVDGLRNRLHLADSGNQRIVSVALRYASEELAPLAGDDPR